MTRIPPFNPADVKPIRQLFSEGKFPPTMKLKHILELCTWSQFPAVKINNEWHTTEAHIRYWVWKQANKPFRDSTS
jgi:hypothetical protein